MISVVIPTIATREHYLAACIDAYNETAPGCEIVVVEGKPVCGAAWIEGAERATGDYIHFSADDLRPHPGWSVAARDVVARGFTPAPRILNDDGTVQSCGGTGCWEQERQTGEQTDFSRIPFLSRDMWEQIEPVVGGFLREAHYYTDNAVGVAAHIRGFPTGVHRDFLFTHSLADPGRGAGMSWENRMRHDWELFKTWVESVPGVVMVN